MSITDVLRDEIDKSDLNLFQIAQRANVSYSHLWRWHSKTTDYLSAVIAEEVHYVLTGRKFS
tara:strand:+ start:2758 stop:2943 length:186 start_codon:yes stop_codon:yes gene_type:complete